MSGSDFHLRERRAVRRQRPVHGGRRHAGSNLWLTSLTAIALVATLAGFQRLPAAPGAGSARVAASVARGEGAAARDALTARFGLCRGGGGRNCVVDGDTFRFAGETYRIADIDTPETHPARCAEEAVLGEAATGRLRTWLNDGAFSLESAGRDADRHGRRLRIVTRGGTSVGPVLVAEGLARPWDGARRPWCQGSGL